MQENPTRYVRSTTWVAQWTVGETENGLDKMIAHLETAAQELRAMRAAGVVYWQGDLSDEAAILVTTDPTVAARFGMAPEDDEEA